MRIKLISFIVCISIILTTACTSGSVPKPDHYGAYLINNNQLIEMKQFGGPPNTTSSPDIPLTSETIPSILLWYPNIDLKYLELRGNAGNGTTVDFTSKPLDQNQLEIKPRKNLSKDIYCLIQGSAMGDPYSTPYWCFNVGSEINTPSSSTKSFQNLERVFTYNKFLFITNKEEKLGENNDINDYVWKIATNEFVYCDDNNVYVYSLSDMFLKKKIGVKGVCSHISPDGNYVASLGIEHTVDVYNGNYKGNFPGYILSIETDEIKEISLDYKMIYNSGIYFSKKNNEIFYDKSNQFYKVKTDEIEYTYCINKNGYPLFSNSTSNSTFPDTILFSDDFIGYPYNILICDQNKMEIIGQISGEKVFKFFSSKGSTSYLHAFLSPDKKKIFIFGLVSGANSSLEANIITVDSITGDILKTKTFPNMLFSWRNDKVNEWFAVSPNGNYLAVSLFIKNKIGKDLYILDSDSLDTIYTSTTSPSSYAINIISFSPDGNLLFAGGEFYKIK